VTVQNEPSRNRVVVWDLPIRLCHWSLAVLIPFAWWTYKTDRMEWHRMAGYAVLGLMAFRLFWGIFGSATARFADFLHGPATIWRYLAGRLPKGVGHNPLGGWSVALLLVLLAVQPLLGLFASDADGLDSGPFADRVSYDQSLQAERLHELLFYALVGLVVLHICAIVYYRLRGESLVLPMITGRAKLPPGTQAPALAPLWLWALGFLLGAAVFGALYRWGG
jgi:cytochrome b